MKTENITFWLSPEQKRRVQDLADDEEIAMGTLVRRAVREYLDRLDATGEPSRR